MPEWRNYKTKYSQLVNSATGAVSESTDAFD